jgi:hypothetical protein
MDSEKFDVYSGYAESRNVFYTNKKVFTGNLADCKNFVKDRTRFNEIRYRVDYIIFREGAYPSNYVSETF